MIAGGLFLFPGIISDVIAVMLLIMPSKNPNENLFQEMQDRYNRKQQKKDDSVIEGEFKKEEDNARGRLKGVTGCELFFPKTEGRHTASSSSSDVGRRGARRRATAPPRPTISVLIGRALSPAPRSTTTPSPSSMSFCGRTCEAGKYRDTSTAACITCAAGQYRPEGASQNLCKLCPEGFFNVPALQQPPRERSRSYPARSIASCRPATRQGWTARRALCLEPARTYRQ